MYADCIAASGWYVTKQSSQEELDLSPTHTQARDREEAFFKDAPWSTMWKGFDKHFGICNLQNAISDKLTDNIY